MVTADRLDQPRIGVCSLTAVKRERRVVLARPERLGSGAQPNNIRPAILPEPRVSCSSAPPREAVGHTAIGSSLTIDTQADAVHQS